MMAEFLHEVGVWLVMLVIYGGPVWLAWWLSDGFAGWRILDSSELGNGVQFKPFPNPRTHGFEMVPMDEKTNLPTRYPT